MTTLGPSFFNGSSSFLQVTRSIIKSLDGFEFRQDSIADFGFSCP